MIRMEKGAPERSGPGAEVRDAGCSQQGGAVIVFMTLAQLRVLGSPQIKAILQCRVLTKGPGQVVPFEGRP